ncbi:MAG: hypothetical protein ACFE9S_20500 [Candidatus Hermodarchaeota archaeon]
MFKDMSRTALSLFIFGLYLIIIAIIFLFIPEILFSIVMVPTDPDIMSRLFGMIILFLAYYIIRAALDEEGLTKFFIWTVHTRATVIIFQIVFVAIQIVSFIVLFFGLIDLAAAI